MHLCVLCGSQNKQRLFLYTALLIGFYNRGRECLLRGTVWVFKSDRYSFVIKLLNIQIINTELQETLSYIFPTTEIASPGSISIAPVVYLHLCEELTAVSTNSVYVAFVGYQLLRGSCRSQRFAVTLYLRT
jgi:hypothetical protein